MPLIFYVSIGTCIAIMALSAWYLGDEDKRIRASARVGIVVGGSTLLVVSFYFAAIFMAVLIVIIPIALVSAWWNGAF